MNTWTFNDPNFSAHIDAGMAALGAGTFFSTTRASEFLSVLALKGLLIGHLLGGVTYTADSVGNNTASVAVDVSTVPGDRADMARALIAPVDFYYRRSGLPALPDDLVFAYNASQLDTGLWPIPVIIVLAISGSAVIAWCAHEYANVKKAIIAQEGATSEIQKLDQKLTDAVNKHVQAEVAAGKPLEMSDAEKAQMKSLVDRVNQLNAAVAEQAAGDNKGPDVMKVLPWAVLGTAALIFVGTLAIKPAPRLAKAA